MTVLLDLHPKRVDTLAVCRRLKDWGFTFRDVPTCVAGAARDHATKEVVAVRDGA